ncbi:MAG: ribonuclease HII [Patescibacteria group bacterium]|nr:ribonuclease HII [Patescibacteria group bacterium]
MKKYVIGIDEVGRGALAGPIFVTALALPKNFRRRESSFLPLKDSKKLRPSIREQWLKYVDRRQDIFYATSKISPKKIDIFNISRAANIAASRAMVKLVSKYDIFCRSSVFLDGGLYLDKKTIEKLNLKRKPKTIIKGDEKINAIKLASVVAKVKRDRFMIKLHEKHPNYEFNIHKGYGTKKHREAIEKNGYSSEHRLSFKFKAKSV